MFIYIILKSKIVLEGSNTPVESNVISKEDDHAKRGDGICNIINVNQSKSSRPSTDLCETPDKTSRVGSYRPIAQ